MRKTRKKDRLNLKNPFILAPLAGVTDAPMRRLCKAQGAALVYTEMVSAKGLWYNDRKTEDLLRIYEDEKPVAFQIFGSEPDIIAAAALKLKDRGNAVLDINMGCPVPKVVKNGDGSALLKDPGLIYDIVKAAVGASGSVPVTVKIRSGWDENSINAVETARAAEAAGASAVAVHGRTRQQFYEGRADWSVIRDVKAAVDIPVIGNGDVFSGQDAVDMMKETGCDYVMIARGALGNPWIFRDALCILNGEEIPEKPSVHDRIDTMIQHLDMLTEEKGEKRAVFEMRKHAAWYSKGLHGAAEFRRMINNAESPESMKELFFMLK